MIRNLGATCLLRNLLTKRYFLGNRTSLGSVISKKPNASGFTLIEIAIVLAIAAALGLAVWRLYPAMHSATTVDVPASALDEAKNAIAGFVLRAHRLPCPASDTVNNSTGLENCAVGASVGSLPYATLGLGATPALRGLRYGVYRNANAVITQDADLAQLKARYLPLTPVVFSSGANGLDFCVGLKNAMVAPTSLSANANGMPIAYGLAHAGQNGVFDGLQTSAAPTFELSTKPATVSYDDRVATVGMGELFAHLRCVERLSAVNGSVRALYAAYDTDRVARQYADYRAFAERVRLNGKTFAAIALAQATVDLAIAGVSNLSAATLTAATGGGAVAVLVPTSLALAAATLAFAAATAAVVMAESAYITAQKQTTAAANHVTNVTAPALTRATAIATLEVKRGLTK
jgi:prepilin-type N-terminal cleavage/methylation domain-containing protein